MSKLHRDTDEFNRRWFEARLPAHAKTKRTKRRKAKASTKRKNPRKPRKTKVPRSISSGCPMCLGGRPHSRAAHDRAMAKIAAKRKNPIIPPGKALAFRTKAAAQSFAKRNGLKGYRIRQSGILPNPKWKR